MRNGYWRILVVSLCLALGGCGGDSAAPSRPPADLIDVLHRSMLEDQDFRAAGLDPAEDTGKVVPGQIDTDPSRPCRTKLRSDADRRKAVQSGYTSDTVQLLQQSFSYRTVDATEVVAQIRKVAKECDTYRMKTGRGDAAYRVDRSLRLSTPDGVDAAYAYCEQAGTGQWLWWVCHVSLAYGKVISTLQVNAATEKQTRYILTKLAPVLAHQLIKATSRP